MLDKVKNHPVLVACAVLAILGSGFTGYKTITGEDFRFWANSSELADLKTKTNDKFKTFQQIAGDLFDRSVKNYSEDLERDQRYLDDRRDMLIQQNQPIPQYLKERQQSLDKKKCEFRNSLLPPEKRQPCL